MGRNLYSQLWLSLGKYFKAGKKDIAEGRVKNWRTLIMHFKG
jgi:hypothetical protein